VRRRRRWGRSDQVDVPDRLSTAFRTWSALGAAL
jgi:hypothetical protein